MTRRLENRLRGRAPTAQDRHVVVPDDLRALYDLPAGATAIFSSVTAAVVGDRWADYRVENLGIVIPPPDTETVRWLPWWCITADGQELCVGTWQRWVRYKDARAFAHACWLPRRQRTEFAVRDLDQARSRAEEEAVWRGRDLLSFENRVKGETDEEAWQRVVAAIQRIQERCHAEGVRVRLTRESLSEELGITPSGWDKLRKRHHFTLKRDRILGNEGQHFQW